MPDIHISHLPLSKENKKMISLHLGPSPLPVGKKRGGAKHKKKAHKVKSMAIVGEASERMV